MREHAHPAPRSHHVAISLSFVPGTLCALWSLLSVPFGAFRCLSLPPQFLFPRMIDVVRAAPAVNETAMMEALVRTGPLSVRHCLCPVR